MRGDLRVDRDEKYTDTEVIRFYYVKVQSVPTHFELIRGMSHKTLHHYVGIPVLYLKRIDCSNIIKSCFMMFDFILAESSSDRNCPGCRRFCVDYELWVRFQNVLYTIVHDMGRAAGSAVEF